MHTDRTVSIIGLGYVGLPLALLFVARGFRVHGVDLDQRKIEMLQRGQSYIHEIDDEEIRAANASGRFTTASKADKIGHSEAVFLCVPTPLTQYGTPDLSYLTAAAGMVSEHLTSGQLIVLESSTYPGTTREVLLPILNQSPAKLQAGKDFFVAYSPERVDPGNKEYPIERIPKIVSGTTPQCMERVKELYEKVFEQVCPVSSTDAAEMAKLLENAYRLINISFINELAMACDALKLDVWEVIEAAGTKPFGFKAFYPGPGIGGHCIPVDPSYLLWKLKQHDITSAFINLSNHVNESMPRYIMQQLRQQLVSAPTTTLAGKKILIYGAAYKPDIADSRESASVALMELLHEEGAVVFYHDPYIPTIGIGGKELASTQLDAHLLQQMDAVVIATNHAQLPLSMLMEHARFIYDTRNVTNGMKSKAAIVKLGGGQG